MKIKNVLVIPVLLLVLTAVETVKAETTGQKP